MLRPLLFALLSFGWMVSCKNNVRPHTQTYTGTVDTTLRILTYGLPDMARQRAMNVVAKNYGFCYYAVAGCIVSEPLLDSVNKENKRVYEKLAQKYGGNWKSAFAAEVDTMKQLLNEAENIVKKEPYIIHKETELKKDSSSLEYFATPTEHENIFFVKAYSWEKQHEQPTPVTYYEVTVDLENKKVIKVQ